MHSHLGVDSVPELRGKHHDSFPLSILTVPLGSDDTNSLKAPTMPYLRSIDGFNTHDEAFALSRSGGVATSLILPGSADNIGGQAFVVKIRKTAQGGPSSMVLEPPATLIVNGTHAEDDGIRWRHMKHAVRSFDLQVQLIIAHSFDHRSAEKTRLVCTNRLVWTASGSSARRTTRHGRYCTSRTLSVRALKREVVRSITWYGVRRSAN